MAKVIVITGAGQGLGRQLALRLAAEGHKLALLGRTRSKVDKVAAEAGDNAFAVECDVGSPASVRAAFAEVAAHHPTIDVLVNNAAVYNHFHLENATDEQIETAVGSNLTGAIYCCRAAIPVLPPGSRIINVSSESVMQNHAMLSVYQSTKAGLDRLTEALRVELKPKGIRLTLVHAGQMKADDFKMPLDMEAIKTFIAACERNGVHVLESGTSHVRDVVEVFLTIINGPESLNIAEVRLEAFASAGWAPRL